MHHLDALRSSFANERGGILVMVALFTPVAILFTAFVIDVGHWFDHKRQLQVKADASALATARAFNTCFQSMDAADSSIYQLAGQYGGTQTIYTPSSVKNGPLNPYPGSGLTVTGSLYNTGPASVSASNNTYTLVNSQRYADQTGSGSPQDSSVPASNADPCNAAMADVKVTEENLPWYMQALSVPFINAHARIQIENETAGTGFLPFSVANTAPGAVTVYVVNEDATPTTLSDNPNAQGKPVCATSSYLLYCVPLTDRGPSTKVNGELFDDNTTPASIQITQPHMGMIVAISGNAAVTSCSQSGVTCFDGGKSLVHIAGYSKAGTGTYSAPLARSVTLSSTSCGTTPTPNQPLYSTQTSSCTFTINATLDVGSTTKGITVTPVVGGTTGTPLTYNSGSNQWSGTASLPNGVNSSQVDLQVKCSKNVAGAPCGANTTATISDVQRVDAADATTSASVQDANFGTSNSFEVCEAQDGNSCTQSLTFSVTTQPGLSPGPLYTMNFAAGSGPSQTGVIGCSGGTSGNNERQDILNGCSGQYGINTNDYPACTNLPSGGPQPWDCLPGNSGIKEGPFFQGINQRFEGSPTPTSCPNPNNYPNYPPNDPRIISLFIVPYGFVAGGINPLPIQQVAAFYVTGWDNSKDPCPTTGAKADDTAGKDQIVGHFINYVNPTGGSGSGSCKFGALQECVAILTQ